MKIDAYICPQCGASLDVSQEVTFTFCPHCGNRLHISYEGEAAPKDPNLRQFVSDDTNVRLAAASLPQSYHLSGSLQQGWQSEFVPMTTFIQASDKERGIVMCSASKEMYTDYCNGAIRRVIQMTGTVNPAFMRDFEDPEDYLTAWASHVTGMNLTPAAKAVLPSRFGQNLDQESSLLLGDFQQMANLEAETGYQLVNLFCEPMLMKYHAGDHVVLAGGDLWGYEAAAPLFSAPDLSGIKNAFSGVTSGFKESVSGMTFNDWMRGGLLGKKLRERKQAAAQPTQPQTQQRTREVPNDGKIPFCRSRDYGKHVDVIVWGSKRKYLMIAPVQREEEAATDFIKFVSTLTADPALEQQAAQMVASRFAQEAQKVVGMRMQAQQMQMQTRQMQMQTSQMISRNAQQVSAGMMDSWNKRQAAQSRMSTGFSEAIRGVNSYVTPAGGTVEMNVAADHVYQNKYGDSIGVSGNAVDSDLASKLNWTELKKK